MRRMEEIAYDDLTHEKLDAPLTKVVVWNGVVYSWDLSPASNEKLDEHMKDFLEMATVVEGDDLATMIADGIGGARWGTPTIKSMPVDDEVPLITPQESSQPAGRPGRQGALSDEDVREIRTSRDAAGALADRYKVSLATIYSVRNGKTYKHVK